MDPRLPTNSSEDQNNYYPSDPPTTPEYPDQQFPEPVAPWETPPAEAPGVQTPSTTYMPPKSPVKEESFHPEKPPVKPAPPPFGKSKGLIIRAFLGLLLFLMLIGIIWKALPLATPKSQEKVELTYWGISSDEDAMREVIQDFEQQNPSITVTYTKQDPQQYRDRLIARMQNGTGPDIFRFHNSWVPMMVPLLYPLNDTVISVNDLRNNYYPTVSSDLVWHNSLIGIPLEIDTLALFTNPDIFRVAGVQPPSSWNDFVDIAHQLTVKDESGKIQTSGVAMGAYDNIDHASDILSLLMLQSGVPLRSIGSNQAKAAEALTFYTSFARDGVWDGTLDPSTLAFVNGKLAMYFGYYSDVLTIAHLKAENNSSLQYEVHPVPILPGQNKTIASYWVEGISNKSQHPKEAEQFLAFLSRKETLEKRYAALVKKQQFGELYPRRDMADELKNDPIAYPFIQQAQNAVSTPFSSGTGDTGITAELNGYLGNAIRASSTNGSVESAIQTLSQGEAQVLARYGL